ncbi:MAG: hypothetical protein B6D61_09730 [Bacteroidetes bacterium 4484_249]|nr:MAG: hypothetical protein B6D61_09730 [Bacteroidetes bacterium 4484_249]
MTENKKCLICGSQLLKPIYENTLLRCENCSFVFANLNIEKLNFNKIYSESYFKGSEYLDYPREKSIIQKNFAKRLKFITGKTDKKDVSNVLEIGCAYGFFGELINKYFPGIPYTGIDISKDAIEYGRKNLGLNLHSVDYLDFETEKVFSDIYLWDVIEHLPEPDKVIAKASSELRRNGRLILTTGDIDSFLARKQKRNWRLIHPPTHLFYFSKKTLIKLLEKNNLQVISISYPSILRSLKQSWYSLFLLDKKKNNIAKNIFRILPDINIKINTFDIMMVMAIKK